MITEADQSFYSDVPTGGVKGMKAARTPALLGYRNAKTYALTQSEENYNKLKDFKVDSYQRYQGDKLASFLEQISSALCANERQEYSAARGILQRYVEQ